MIVPEPAISLSLSFLPVVLQSGRISNFDYVSLHSRSSCPPATGCLTALAGNIGDCCGTIPKGRSVNPPPPNLESISPVASRLEAPKNPLFSFPKPFTTKRGKQNCAEAEIVLFWCLSPLPLTNIRAIAICIGAQSQDELYVLTPLPFVLECRLLFCLFYLGLNDDDDHRSSWRKGQSLLDRALVGTLLTICYSHNDAQPISWAAGKL